MPYEAGHFGQGQTGLVSLGGIVGAYGRGRLVLDHSTALSTTDLTVLSSNVKRLWAFIQIIGATDAWAQLGAAAAANTGFYLAAGGGYLLINQDNPWTGDVHAIVAAGTPTLTVLECSLP